MVTKLSVAELNKHEGVRWDNLAKRIEKGKPVYINGQLTIIGSSNPVTQRQLVAACKQRNLTSFKTRFGINLPVLFSATARSFVNLSDIDKDANFIDEKAHPLDKEIQQRLRLSNMVEHFKRKHGRDVIYCTFNDKDVFSVASVEKTPGSVKSDIQFCNERGAPVIWMSHKWGSSQNDFQQWGGVSSYTDRPYVCQHLEKIRSLCSKSFVEGVRYGSNTVPVDESMSIVYGKDFYGERLGSDNVSFVAQGDVKLVETSDSSVLKIVASTLLLENGSMIPDPYYPAIVSSYRRDRNQFGIKNHRVGFYPKNQSAITWL